MKKLAQHLIFSADCSQSMGLPPVLKIRRFENYFFFCFVPRSGVTFVQNPKLSKNRGVCKYSQNRYLRGTVCTRIQYMRGGGTKDPPQKQTWRLDEIKKRKTEIFKTSDFLAQIVASR
jgi:hypothetical protein